MGRTLPRDEGGSLSVRRPRPGLTVIRFTGERPLMRAIPEHYGTTMHLGGRSRWTSVGAEWSSAPGSVSVKYLGGVVVERAREGTLDFQSVLFDASLVDEARDALGRRAVARRVLPPGDGDPRVRRLAVLHRRLLDEPPEAVLEEAVCDALYALVDVVEASREREDGGRVSYGAAVVRALALLDARFTEAIGLDALADHARLDKFRLCRAFREHVGLPPHAYVTHRRIALAQRLLALGVPQSRGRRARRLLRPEPAPPSLQADPARHARRLRERARWPRRAHAAAA